MRGLLTKSCKGHYWLSSLKLHKVNNVAFEAFGVKVKGRKDAPPGARFARWDGTVVQKKGCPGGAPSPPGPTRCSPPSATLDASDGTSGAGATATKSKRRNRRGKLVNVVNLFSSLFVPDYLGSGLSAFLSINGRLPAGI